MIVYSGLVEYTYKNLKGRFIDRYMPNAERDYWCKGMSYFYSIETQSNNSGVNVIIRDKCIARSSPFPFFRRIQRDIRDMNACAEANGNPTGWTTDIEKYELRRIEGMPLREDFDKPRYQLKITIPNASGV